MALFQRLRTPEAAPGPLTASGLSGLWAAAPVPCGSADTAQLSISAGLQLHLSEPLRAGTVKLDGELSGELHLHNFVQGRSGAMTGELHCDHAQLRGTFDGDLVVHGRLTVFASALVRGRVRCSDIVLWNGARLEAEIVGPAELEAADTVAQPPRRGRAHLALLKQA
jgi:cytoskeletal protein CcmA (bactofilin family)